jgi:transposase
MNKYSFQTMLGFEQLYTNNKTINFYEKLFSSLDLSGVTEFPHKSEEPTKHEGRKPISRHNIFRSFLVMKTQRFAQVSQLIDYLENNIAVALVCGFEGGRIPGKDVFYDFLRDVPQSELENVLTANTLAMLDLKLVDLKNLITDSTPIFANTKLNNPKYFTKNKFSKTNNPVASPNCRLGIHSASNDSNNKNYKFFWGYKDHILLDAKYGLPVFNLTMNADTHDVKAGEELIKQADSYIVFNNRVKSLICDKAYDSNPFYEFIKKTLGANVIAPLKSNSKTTLFNDSVPVCEAGLSMHRCGRIYRESGIRFKFSCPFRNSKSKSCPCNHPAFQKNVKYKGCIKYMCLKAANLRNCTDRDSPSFKSLYSKRSAIERYNARFKFMENEKAFLHSKKSISTIVSISHICSQLIAIVSAKNHALEFVRSLAGIKRVA